MDLRETTADVRQRHPWEMARFQFFRRLLDKVPKPTGPKLKILDVGSGDSWIANQLNGLSKKNIEILCWDEAYNSDKLESLRSTNVDIDFTSIQPKEKFDLVLMLDVLEHVSDDRTFLKSIVEENIEENGFVLISVPTWNSLFCFHDEFLGHKRRYSPKQCANLIQESGLEILQKGGLFHSLLLARLIEKQTQQIKLLQPRDKKVGVGHWKKGPKVSSVVNGFLKLDNSLSYLLSRMGIDTPGLSWWALCQKKKNNVKN